MKKVGTEGGGGTTDGVATTCDGATHAYTLLCGSPEGSTGGGASWRIYKIEDNAWGLDDSNDYSANILNEQHKKEAIQGCSKEGWFASYGWDGRTDSHYGYDNYNYQIGPARRSEGVIRQAVYNDYGAMDYDTPHRAK